MARHSSEKPIPTTTRLSIAAAKHASTNEPRTPTATPLPSVRRDFAVRDVNAAIEGQDDAPSCSITSRLFLATGTLTQKLENIALSNTSHSPQ